MTEEFKIVGVYEYKLGFIESLYELINYGKHPRKSKVRGGKKKKSVQRPIAEQESQNQESTNATSLGTATLVTQSITASNSTGPIDKRTISQTKQKSSSETLMKVFTQNFKKDFNRWLFNFTEHSKIIRIQSGHLLLANTIDIGKTYLLWPHNTKFSFTSSMRFILLLKISIDSALQKIRTVRVAEAAPARIQNPSIRLHEETSTPARRREPKTCCFQRIFMEINCMATEENSRKKLRKNRSDRRAKLDSNRCQNEKETIIEVFLNNECDIEPICKGIFKKLKFIN